MWFGRLCLSNFGDFARILHGVMALWMENSAGRRSTNFLPSDQRPPTASVRPSVRPSTLHSTFAHSGLPSRIRGFLRLVSAKAAFARAKLTLFPRSKCSLDFPCLTFDPSQTNDFYIEKWQPCTVADERKVATLYSCR